MSDPDVPSGLAETLDALYALPLADFTDARNAAVKRHRADGERDTAERLKSLKKPSLAAWVVNMLVRRESAQVDQVLSLGEQLREAQQSLDGDELRTLTRQRRQLTAAVTTQARSVARGLGTKVTPAVAEQVEQTLHAAMVDVDAAEAVRTGLLVRSLSASGLGQVDLADALADPALLGSRAVPVAADAEEDDEGGRPELHVVPDPGRDVADAEEAVGEAEDAVAEARTAVEEVAAELSELEARNLQLQGEVDEHRRRLAELEHELEQVDAEVDDTEERRDEAQQELEEAEKVLEQARRRLARLSSD